MAYQFKLEGLLRLQRSREKQEENRLLACAARLVALNAELEILEAARIAKKRALQEEMRSGMLAALLRADTVWEETARKKASDLKIQCELARKARQEQLQRYREVRQSREVLESLKDRQKATFEAEDARRMQRDLDAMYLAGLKPTETE